MPEVHIPNWVQLIVHATQEGTERITTHNYKTIPDVVSAQTANDLAFAFWQQISPEYPNCCHPSVNFDYVECRTLYPQAENFQGIYYIPQPAPGTRTGEALPGNVAAGVRWKTGIRGRKYRGRNNFFGLDEPSVNGSKMLLSILDDFVVLAVQMLLFEGTPESVTYPVVASRRGEFLTNVLGFTIDYLIDSQRTRLLQRGD